MVQTAVRIRVEVADALSRRSQLLIVRHAQHAYGVDATVADRLGISPLDLPAPGDYFQVSSNGIIGAESVVLIGVPSLLEFGYKEVREFGRAAVSLTSEVAPGARELCITLHGPGFGLDENESFESELAGVVAAVEAREMSSRLEDVTFLERDPQRAERMEQALTALLPRHRVELLSSSRGSIGSWESNRLRTVGLDSAERGHAFVAMPFEKSFDDIFYYGIAPSIHAAGVLCERMDELAFTGDVVQRLRERIAKAQFVVADVSGANPNVYLEVGFAWGRDVPTILVCKDTAELKFDIRGQRCVTYGTIRDLETKLTREVTAIFPHAQALA
jgi:hypothetical protein